MAVMISQQMPGDFRNESRDKQGNHIPFQVMRVQIALDNQETENGKGQSSDASHPLIDIRIPEPHLYSNDIITHMVYGHGDKGDHFQRTAAETY